MGFAYYSPISINSGQVPSTQTDFPVLVSQTDNRFKTVGNGGHVANANGYDIRPYSDTALTSALSYELERYNATTGEVIMWVKVASLSSSTTPIYLGYGNTGLTTDGSSTATWSNSFTMVAHLKDGTTLNVADSTGTFTGTNNGATAATGKVDGGANFASASSQYIAYGTFSGLSAVTLSAWVNASSFPNTYNTTVGYHRSSSSCYAELYVKSNGKLGCFVFANGADKSYDGTGSNTLSTSTTYYLCLTYDSSSGLIGYVNAGLDGTASANNVLTTAGSTPINIGRDPEVPDRKWDGMLDECRIASVARSANWITTEYNNQSAPGTFETLGAEVDIGMSGLFTM